MTRRISIAALLSAALVGCTEPPEKPHAPTNAPAAPGPAAVQTVRNWNFSLQKEGRTQGRFHGDTARIVAPREFDVESMKAETFRADGESDMVAESPACRVAITTNGFLVTSSGALKLTQADGRFGLTGEGFRWDHGAERLTVSNHVESFLNISLPRTSPAPVR